MKTLILAAFACAGALQVASIQCSAVAKATIIVKNNTNELALFQINSKKGFEESERGREMGAADFHPHHLPAGLEKSKSYDCSVDLIRYWPNLLKYEGKKFFTVAIPCNATHAIINSDDSISFKIAPKAQSESGAAVASAAASNAPPGGPAME